MLTDRTAEPMIPFGGRRSTGDEVGESMNSEVPDGGDSASMTTSALASTISALAELCWEGMGNALNDRVVHGKSWEEPTGGPFGRKAWAHHRDSESQREFLRREALWEEVVDGLPPDTVAALWEELGAGHWHLALAALVEFALGTEAALKLPTERVLASRVVVSDPAAVLNNACTAPDWTPGFAARMSEMVGTVGGCARRLTDPASKEPERERQREELRAAVARLDEELRAETPLEERVDLGELRTAISIVEARSSSKAIVARGSGLASRVDLDRWLTRRGLDSAAEELRFALQRCEIGEQASPTDVLRSLGPWGLVSDARCYAELVRLGRRVEQAEDRDVFQLLQEATREVASSKDPKALWLSRWTLFEMAHALLLSEVPPPGGGDHLDEVEEGVSPERLIWEHFGGNDVDAALAGYRVWRRLSGTPPVAWAAGLSGDDRRWAMFAADERERRVFGAYDGDADDENGLELLPAIEDAARRAAYLSRLAELAKRHQDSWGADGLPGLGDGLASVYSENNFTLDYIDALGAYARLPPPTVEDGEAEELLERLEGFLWTVGESVRAEAWQWDGLSQSSRRREMRRLAGEMRDRARVDLSDRVLASTDPLRFARHAGVISLRWDAERLLLSLLRAKGDDCLKFEGRLHDTWRGRGEVEARLEAAHDLDLVGDLLEASEFDLGERIQLLAGALDDTLRGDEDTAALVKFSSILGGWLERCVAELERMDPVAASWQAERAGSALVGVSAHLEQGIVDLTLGRLERFLDG